MSFKTRIRPAQFQYSILATYLSSLLGYTFPRQVSPFHPHARYPGPFLAKVCKLFKMGVVMKGRGKYQVRPQRVCNTDRLPKQDPSRSEQLFYFRKRRCCANLNSS